MPNLSKLDAAKVERRTREHQLPPVSVRIHLRKSAGYSIIDAADAVETSPLSYWRWETGRSEPRPENRARYRAFLDAIARGLS